MKTIALIAHDAVKKTMAEWVGHNYEILSKHKLICTGTTGRIIKEELLKKGIEKTDIELVKSGPTGGDQQIGSMIADNKIDIVIFFADHLSIQAHDSDIKALSRLAGLYNIPMACNRSTADYLITSPLFSDDTYQRIVPNFEKHNNRMI
jgi:methylglyoxal synthase